MEEHWKKRITVCSFISIVLVVLIHSYNVNLVVGGKYLTNKIPFYYYYIEYFISGGISRVAVPLFFTISGFLFFYGVKEYARLSFYMRKIKSRFRSLLLPFMLWSALGITLWYILQQLPASAPYFNSAPIASYSIKELLTIWLVYPNSFHLWFLQILFILVLLSPLIGYVIEKTKWLAVVVFLCGWIFLGGTTGYQEYFFEGLFFFSLGAFGHIHFLLIKDQSPSIRLLLICFFLWIALLIGRDFIPEYRLLFLKISILFGCVTVYYISDWLAAKFSDKLPTYFYLSFWLYLVHEPYLTLVKKFIISFDPYNVPFRLLIYFLAPLFVVVTALFVGMFLKRRVPVVIVFLTGGRK